MIVETSAQASTVKSADVHVHGSESLSQAVAHEWCLDVHAPRLSDSVSADVSIGDANVPP